MINELYEHKKISEQEHQAFLRKNTEDYYKSIEDKELKSLKKSLRTPQEIARDDLKELFKYRAI